MSLDAAIAAVVLLALSALPGWLWCARAQAGQRVACALACAGAIAGLGAAGVVLAGGGEASAALGSRFVEGGVRLHLDALGALFLVPILIVTALGAVYGLRYWPHTLGPKGRRLQSFYGLTAAAMTLLVLADHALVFLAAWEVMALGGFFLILTEHEKRDVQRAAVVYLAATHLGTLCLFAMFALLGHAAGSLAFADLARLSGATPHATSIFALALLGFGVKAGLMPLHFWLPDAHAAAPSHVSALMSGVLIKMGIFGLMRVTGFFQAPPAAWGFAVLAAGAISGVLGVVLALAQHDLKRLLAYHSVENIGIIALGLGLALLGRARGDAALIALGFAGAALHVLNHAIFKSLLFFGAGAVQHATGTREIDLLGGLARGMPYTALAFLVGAVAISGLPPLNGFASEWLVYMGFLRSMSAAELTAFAAFGAGALALIGALATACFAKVYGMVFLGRARTAHAEAPSEAPAAMLAPMIVLASACAAIGLFAFALLPALVRAASAWAHAPQAELAGAAVPALHAAAAVATVCLALAALTGALWLLRRRVARAEPVRAAVTWDCGYAAPTVRMQYTGSSFAQLLLTSLPWPLLAHPRGAGPTAIFPVPASFHSDVSDAAVRHGVLPLVRATSTLAALARRVHAVRAQAGVLFVLATLLALFAWRLLR